MIASERYESFAAALQTEYVQEFGIRFGRIEPQAFSKLARTTAGEEQKPVGQETSARIWTDLHAHGYFDANGDIQGKFEPDNVLFKLEIDEEFEDLRVAIVDEMRKYVFKNRFPMLAKNATYLLTNKSTCARISGSCGSVSVRKRATASILTLMNSSTRPPNG